LACRGPGLATETSAGSPLAAGAAKTGNGTVELGGGAASVWPQHGIPQPAAQPQRSCLPGAVWSAAEEAEEAHKVPSSDLPTATDSGNNSACSTIT
jgi:hypothetical protein